jgi:uncharacterized protein
MLSIIIPTLNEAAVLGKTLAAIGLGVELRPSWEQTLGSQTTAIEVIVVDGGSQDETLAIAQDWGAKVVESPPGRAKQMNQGAAMARGNLLLFLHGDTQLPQGFLTDLEAVLAKPQVVAGAFGLEIDDRAWGLRLVEWGVEVRSRWFQMPYGDQGIFIRADRFREVGGFRDMPIMEDFALMQGLKKLGRIEISPSSVKTHARRWQHLGIWRTTGLNQVMIMGYLLGVPLDTLKTWYRTQRRS